MEGKILKKNMRAIPLFYSVCWLMVKGEHLWVSMKTSKCDWKRVQHEVFPLITQLSVSTFVRRARFRPR
jgi:hypothetical protein